MTSSQVISQTVTDSAPQFTTAATSEGGGEGRGGASVAGAALTFATVSPYIYAFVGLVGIVANTFVAVVIATSPSLRKRIENSLLFNQSLIDGVTGLLLVTSLTSSLPITQTGGFWDFICRYWMSGTPLFSALQASIINLVIITVERYVEIVHPIAHKVHQSRRLVKFLVVLPWVLGLCAVIHVPLFKQGIGGGQCRQGNTWPNLAAQEANGWTSLCLKYLLPLAVFIFCYSRMIISLQRSKRSIATLQPHKTIEDNSTLQSTSMERARRNVIKTLLLVTIAHVVCWGPNQGVYMATQVFNVNVDRNGALYGTSIVAIYVNGCINPFIYAACYTAFKDDLYRRFSRSFLRTSFHSNQITIATPNLASG